MTIFLFILHYNSGKQIARGGWSGFAKASSGVDLTGFGLNPTSIPPGVIVKTLPKALRTQALTASTSSFGLILWVGFGMFGSVSLLG